MGRPKKGSKAVGTAAKSLRLSNDQRAALEQVAEQRHTTLHAVMREAVLSVLRERVAWPRSRAPRSRAKRPR